MSVRKRFFNGRIFTSRTNDEELHQAMLVEDDKIVCVGTNEDVAQEVSQVGSDGTSTGPTINLMARCPDRVARQLKRLISTDLSYCLVSWTAIRTSSCWALHSTE